MSGQRFLSHFAVIDESFAVWQVNSDPSSLWQIGATPPVQSENVHNCFFLCWELKTKSYVQTRDVQNGNRLGLNFILDTKNGPKPPINTNNICCMSRLRC